MIMLRVIELKDVFVIYDTDHYAEDSKQVTNFIDGLRYNGFVEGEPYNIERRLYAVGNYTKRFNIALICPRDNTINVPSDNSYDCLFGENSTITIDDVWYMLSDNTTINLTAMDVVKYE